MNAIPVRPAPEPLTPADRRAMARAGWAVAGRAAAIAAYLGVTFAAAYGVLKLEVEGPLRYALIWGPIVLSAGVGGVVARTLRAMDERERALAYRAFTYGALGLAGMMMGAAASFMSEPGRSGGGLASLAFMALPLLLAWAMLAPPLLRLLRQDDRSC